MAGQPEFIRRQYEFAAHIRDPEHRPAPADVEFGFVNGDLRLFQIRPFLDSKMAKGISYLQQMDVQLQNTASVRVNMNGVPNQ